MKRVLVANRGEIAVRVVRACRDLGIESVAVFSDPDIESPHVHLADRAVRIGEAPAADSYLNIDRLLAAAADTGADAVHPGYGFLAERAEFAEAVIDAGLTFVGPSAEAIRAMGQKTNARRRMEAVGVPVVPGTTEPVSDLEQAVAIAQGIGFPVLLKAVAGGGGKGMRLAETEDALRRGFAQATSEALKAFGDGSVYLERYLMNPRHVEIQVLGDTHGRVVHLGERECSIQRRHQKLIEEAPSPAVDGALRHRMGEAAVAAAESVQYVGAGTIEFLLEPDGRFHFLEMNTRIQVEHPITEEVYGIDLVREQLRIAAGEPLSISETPAPRCHSIECRLTAEDPYDGFLPATGRIDYLGIPTGPGVRWDGGIGVGNEIGLFYDPLLAKLIVSGSDRETAIARMRRALDELVIAGVATSQPFHRRVMRDPQFVSGAYSIRYLEERGASLLQREAQEDDLVFVAAAAALDMERQRTAALPPHNAAAERRSEWLRAARREGLR